jgi:serine/threonine protein kinase
MFSTVGRPSREFFERYTDVEKAEKAEKVKCRLCFTYFSAMITPYHILKKLKAFSSIPECGLKSLSELVPNAEPDFLDILSKLLKVDPRDRLSATEALKHSFLNDEELKSPDMEVLAKEPLKRDYLDVEKEGNLKVVENLIAEEIDQFIKRA